MVWLEDAYDIEVLGGFALYKKVEQDHKERQGGAVTHLQPHRRKKARRHSQKEESNRTSSPPPHT